MSEVFKYNIGDFLKCEMSECVYQVVKCVPEVENAIGDNGNRYYVRKIFNGKFDFKAGKAELIHETWLRNLSKNKMDRVKLEIKKEEISAFVNNIIFDPDFDYEYYVYLNKSPYFIIKKEDVKEIQREIDNTIADDKIYYDDDRINGIVQSFIENGVMIWIKEYDDMKSDILKENEAFYRMEIGRYENDFSPEEDYTKPFYRKIRFVKYSVKK